MTSLNKFKQRLRGELVKKELSANIRPEVVAEPIAVSVVVEPIIAETEQVSIVDVVEDVIEDVEDVTEDTAELSKLESMTKTEIDGYAAEHGIQLDRRQSKFNMITEFIQKIEEKN